MTFPALEVVLPLALVCTLAFTIETALGFGATLITVALGSFFLDLEHILPALVPLNLVLSGYLVVRYGQHVDRAFLVKRLAPFMALGLPIGITLFTALDASMLKRLFGLFLVGVSTLELWRMRAASPVKHLDPWSERLLLIAGGAIHGAFATGGPMAVYVTSRVVEDKNAYRATLSALWTVLNVILLASYGVGGQLDGATAGLALGLVPSIAIGMVVGEALHARPCADVPRDRVRDARGRRPRPRRARLILPRVFRARFRRARSPVPRSAVRGEGARTGRVARCASSSSTSRAIATRGLPCSGCTRSG